jgi:hypothetical protein
VIHPFIAYGSKIDSSDAACTIKAHLRQMLPPL